MTEEKGGCFDRNNKRIMPVQDKKRLPLDKATAADRGCGLLLLLLVILLGVDRLLHNLGLALGGITGLGGVTSLCCITSLGGVTSLCCTTSLGGVTSLGGIAGLCSALVLVVGSALVLVIGGALVLVRSSLGVLALVGTGLGVTGLGVAGLGSTICGTGTGTGTTGATLCSL